MKYTLHDNLVFNIEAETEEEQALVNFLSRMDLCLNGHGINNAGCSFRDGRRHYLSYVFMPKKVEQRKAGE